jgi:hypothetical protein
MVVQLSDTPRDTAVKRFHALEAKFKQNPQFKREYKEVINDYLILNHAEKVTTVRRSGGKMSTSAAEKGSHENTAGGDRGGSRTQPRKRCAGRTEVDGEKRPATMRT